MDKIKNPIIKSRRSTNPPNPPKYVNKLSKSEITKIIVCYPGRFQPCGLHHAITFKTLKARFDAIGAETYMVTSNKVELPKSPFNFDEKKAIINAHGIKEVVQVNSPYIADELLKQYDAETTAVIYAVGQKDMSGPKPRFKPGLKKNGEPTYYQYYYGNENKLQSYRNHGYLVVVPTEKILFKIPGEEEEIEMSGTVLRDVLIKIDHETFKEIMGIENENISKVIYDLIQNKLSSSAAGDVTSADAISRAAVALADAQKVLADEGTGGGGGGDPESTGLKELEETNKRKFKHEGGGSKRKRKKTKRIHKSKYKKSKYKKSKYKKSKYKKSKYKKSKKTKRFKKIKL
jgi:hypothetical protein